MSNLIPDEDPITIKKLFSGDMLMKHRNTNDFSGSMIQMTDDEDTSEVKYFEVLQVSDDCSDVQVGDVVMVPWPRVMQPFLVNGERVTITNEKEVWAILDYD